MDQSAELLEEAAEARALAAQVTDSQSIRDLLRYADALELEAERISVGPELKTPSAHPSNIWDQRSASEPSRESRQPECSPKIPCAG